MKNKTFSNKAEYKENFPIGSSHWFNTLNGQLSRMADYILNTEKPKMYLIEDYAKKMKNICYDFAEWREQARVPVLHIDSVIDRLNYHAAQLTEYKKQIEIN